MEFMLCMSEEKDPRKCLNEGKEVTRCGLEFLHKVKDNCATEFTEHWKCVDHSGYDMNLKNCKKSQAVFDKCILAHFGQEKPEIGYFSKVRLHHTKRARPDTTIEFPEPLPEPPSPKDFKLTPEQEKYGCPSNFPGV